MCVLWEGFWLAPLCTCGSTRTHGDDRFSFYYSGASAHRLISQRLRGRQTATWTTARTHTRAHQSWHAHTHFHSLTYASYSCMHSRWLTRTLMSWLGVITSENAGFRVKIYGHKLFGPLSMRNGAFLNTSAQSVCGFVRPGDVAECLKLTGWLKGFGSLLYIPPSQSEKWFRLNVVDKKTNDSPQASWRFRCDCGPVNSG